MLAVGEHVVPPGTDGGCRVGQNERAKKNSGRKFEHLFKFLSRIDQVFENFERGQQLEGLVLGERTGVQIKTLGEKIFTVSIISPEIEAGITHQSDKHSVTAAVIDEALVRIKRQ